MIEAPETLNHPLAAGDPIYWYEITPRKIGYYIQIGRGTTREQSLTWKLTYRGAVKKAERIIEDRYIEEEANRRVRELRTCVPENRVFVPGGKPWGCDDPGCYYDYPHAEH